MLGLDEAQELLSRYCFAHDSQNPELLAKTLAHDIAMFGVEGRDAVVAAYAESYKKLTRRRRHVLTNFMFMERDESRAKVQAYESFYLIDDDKHEIELHLTGIYRVTVVKQQGEWLILEIDGSFDVPYDPGDAAPLPARRYTE